MRISSKGQITIPQHIREQYGLLPHTDVILEINSAGDIVLRKNNHDTHRGAALEQNLTQYPGLKLTTHEIMKLTRS